MRLTHLAYVLALAATTGLGSAWAVLSERTPFHRVRAGPWETYPRAGAPDADPYARAAMTQRAHLPLGTGEGLALMAYGDDAGGALDSACDYVVTGVVPPARGWTLTLARVDAPLAATTGERLGFSDGEVTRDEAGRLTIRLSRQARAGDWLPLPDIGPFRLVLRLYDTPVSGTASELKARDLPAIRREGCS